MDYYLLQIYFILLPLVVSVSVNKQYFSLKNYYKNVVFVSTNKMYFSLKNGNKNDLCLRRQQQASVRVSNLGFRV